MKKKSLFFFLFFFVVKISTAQNHPTTDNYGSWFNFNVLIKFANKWTFHIENNVRQTNFISNTSQILPRIGMVYSINNQLSLTGGYAFIYSYPYGEFPAKAEFPEHRVWEQVQIKNQLNATEWTSRFRLEQRWIIKPVSNGAGGFVAADTSTYTNRFRLNNKFSTPFKGKTIEDKSVYWYAADELFVNFGDNVAANFFDQNRFQVGLGYKIPHYGKLEFGYLLQSFIKSDGIKVQHDHNLVLSWNCGLSLMKKKK